MSDKRFIFMRKGPFVKFLPLYVCEIPGKVVGFTIMLNRRGYAFVDAFDVSGAPDASSGPSSTV